MAKKNSEIYILIAAIASVLYSLHVIFCNLIGETDFDDKGILFVCNFIVIAYKIALIIRPVALFIKNTSLIIVSAVINIIYQLFYIILLASYGGISDNPLLLLNGISIVAVWAFVIAYIIDFNKDKKIAKYYFVSAILSAVVLLAYLVNIEFDIFDCFAWIILCVVQLATPILITLWLKTSYDEELAEANSPESTDVPAQGTAQVSSQTASNASITKDAGNAAELLKQYKELLDSGIISEEEFNSKKEELLKAFL